MALALKYRLFCGSVVLSSPFLYHEWYYSQLKETCMGRHFPTGVERFFLALYTVFPSVNYVLQPGGLVCAS